MLFHAQLAQKILDPHHNFIAAMSGWSPFMGDTDLENIAKATIHLLRNHIFRLFGPLSLLCKHVLCTENKQRLPFSNLPLPIQVLTEFMNGPKQV